MSPRRGLAGDEHADVVVIGGGFTGCTAALELRRRHRRTVLLEAGAVGVETRLGHVPTGPARVYPYADGAARELARQEWQWMREGHERLRDWMSSLSVECSYRAAGGFLMATTREQAAELAEAEDALREDTFSSEFLDHYMLEARFDVTGLVASLWMCDDGDLDAGRLVRALAEEAESRGALLFERSAARRLEITPGGVVVHTATGRVTASEAVVCAGDGTLDLLPQLEPLWRRLEVSTATYTSASPAIPSPSRLLGGHLAWRTDGAGVRASGTAATADQPAVERDRDAAVTRHLPAVRSHAGASVTMAGTVDGLPVVGPIGDGRVVVAAGHGDGALAWAPLVAAWAVGALGGDRGVPAALAADRKPPVNP